VEEFGISSAEELAAGTPVIGPRAGGTGEIVDDGETGVLFERVDADSAAAAIRESIGRAFDPDACRRAGERYSEERFLAELEPVLRPDSAVSPSRRPSPASPSQAPRSRA